MGQWYAAFNTGDAAAIIRLYAPDATLLLQGRAFEGRSAIEAFHRSNFAAARFSCTWTIDAASVVDRLAALWGTDQCAETPASGGAPSRWSGHWLTVFQMQSDGQWMIVRDSGEEDRPPGRAVGPGPGARPAPARP
jgi:uncharacterized protein (TIGR02246 family)